MFFNKAIFIFLVFASPLATLQARNLNCSEAQFFKNRSVSVSELVKKSDTIVYATAEKFVPDNSDDRFPGYYMFSILSEIKGPYISQLKVKGDKPYNEIPQHYIHMTDYHNRLNFDNLYGSNVAIVEEGKGTCYLLPKFKIGWNYLILLGSESELSYELINSVVQDPWFKAVKAEAFKK